MAGYNGLAANRFEQIVDHARREIRTEYRYEIEIAVRDGVRGFLDDVTLAIDGQLRVLLENLGSNFTDRTYLQKANQEIASQMIEAVVESYDGMTRARSAPHDYRVGTGRIGGTALRSVLGTEAVAKASYDGIAFLNKTELYSAAAFWRRLNFGSGDGQASLPPIAFTLFGQGFASPPTSVLKGKRNTMPPGLWFTDEGGGRIVSSRTRNSSDVFAPIRSMGTARSPVAEIQPWQFLSAGIERFNKIAGPIYEKMVRKIIEDQI